MGNVATHQNICFLSKIHFEQQEKFLSSPLTFLRSELHRQKNPFFCATFYVYFYVALPVLSKAEFFPGAFEELTKRQKKSVVSTLYKTEAVHHIFAQFI